MTKVSVFLPSKCFLLCDLCVSALNLLLGYRTEKPRAKGLRIMSQSYETVIGLEVHVQLTTNTKIFCGCSKDFGQATNSQTCPVCLGLPGALPVLNQQVVELAIKTGLATNCQIAPRSIFARKNYFYPDLPKGYQISQYEYPLAEHGHLNVHTANGPKSFRITRAHLEEDTGKLTHINDDGEPYSLVDLNRAGVPLLEIVSEPDMHSVADVRAYSRELRLLLRWIGVTSGDMEKGTMRFEANVSMRPCDSEELGTRVEIKNLNSFKAMERAILYELEKQSETLQKGGKVKQQTLGWNDNESRTFSQRTKEEANDYRYFPEPDLPPLVVDADWLESIRAEMPELPDVVRARYSQTYHLSAEDIERLMEDRSAAQYFEYCLAAASDLNPRVIVNWMLTDLYAWLNQKELAVNKLALSPQAFTELVGFVEDGTVNQTTAKEVLVEMLESGKGAAAIIDKKGLRQISNTDVITSLVREVLEEIVREGRSPKIEPQRRRERKE